jgi:hypothetical protein
LGKNNSGKQRAEALALLLLCKKEVTAGSGGSPVIKGAIVSGFVLPSFE